MTVLSIVILSYNTKDLTIRCVESIVNQYKGELENGEFEIVVVDNASTDGSPSVISNIIRRSPDQISNIKLIKNKDNYGFAKGCNIGVDKSQGKYLLFLNSDTEVLDKGFLGMTEFLENNQKISILGGKLLNKNGSSQPSCGKFYTPFNLFVMLIGMERFGFLRKNPSEIQKVDWVSGGCMMLKKSFFEKLNGFDEKFFMYMEDMELCYRAQKLGFSTYFYPNVKVLHKKLGSSNKSFAIIHIYKGLLYFYKRHRSHFEYALAKVMLTGKALSAILVGFLIGSLSLREAYKKAIRF